MDSFTGGATAEDFAAALLEQEKARGDFPGPLPLVLETKPAPFSSLFSENQKREKEFWDGAHHRIDPIRSREEGT